ncbi:MAG: selenium-binding protein [Mycoplasmataceae bacterium]|nr:selenium-binding protein [Mycoplasmataceae bacterium]
MIVTTTDNIPGKTYEIISFISSNRTMSIFAKTEIDKVKNKLIDEASAMGADAIVGVRIFATPNGGTAMYGTAVKFT